MKSRCADSAERFHFHERSVAGLRVWFCLHRTVLFTRVDRPTTHSSVSASLRYAAG
jgi:hypothetical protein